MGVVISIYLTVNVSICAGAGQVACVLVAFKHVSSLRLGLIAYASFVIPASAIIVHMLGV